MKQPHTIHFPAIALIAFAGLIASAHLASSVPIAGDDFTYPNGSLAGKTGGFGNWTSEWVTDPGATQYQVQGNVARFTIGTGNNITSIARSFTQTLDNQTIYFSALMSTTEIGTQYSHFTGIYDKVSQGEFVSVGLARGQFALAMSTSDAPFYTQSEIGSYSAGSTHLVVGKIEFNVNGGSKERATMWIDPTGVESAAITLSLQADTRGSFVTAAQLATALQNQNATATVDNLRVGSDWASVAGIPEPSAGVFLVGTFLLLFVGKRRTRVASSCPGNRSI